MPDKRSLPQSIRGSRCQLSALSLAMLCLLLLPACNDNGSARGNGGDGPSGPPPVNVLTTTVRELPYAPAIELRGEMRSRQRVTLASEVSGRIRAISARVGDEVGNGIAFIHIDYDEYNSRLAIAESELRQARAELSEAQSGPRSEEIAEQEAAVAQAQAAADDARDMLERLEQLRESGIVSEQELASARNALAEAEAAVEEERQVLGRLRAGTREEQLDALRGRVAAAEHSRDIARLELSRCRISPDFNASLTALHVEVGQYVNIGTPLAELVSSAPAEAWLSLPELERDRIADGTAVEIRADAIPGEVFHGTVAGISDAADSDTRQFPLRVDVSEARLLPGMSVHARLLLTEPEPRLLFSQDAAFDSRLGLVVYRVGNAAGEELPGFETVNVELGERVDGLVVLEGGDLMPGDRLVTRGKESLFEGARLRIQDELAAQHEGSEAK